MKFVELSACALLLLGAVGCGRAAAPTSAASPTSIEDEAAALASLADGARVPLIAESLDEPLVNPYREALDVGPKDRNVGDFVIYRFSGSYRASPVTVTQRVVAKRPGVLVIDVSLEEGGHKDELRLRLRQQAGSSDELISVARLEGGVQHPFGTEAYEALMARTMPPVIANESVLGTGSGTVEVGGARLPCQRTAYRIFTGSAQATMTTLESPSFAWGDLGGEVVGEDGALLYRAEVVDYGTSLSGAPIIDRPGSSVATYEDDDYEDDYASGIDVYE